MARALRSFAVVVVLAVAMGLLCVVASYIPAEDAQKEVEQAAGGSVLRVALFNVKELSADKLGAGASEADAEQVSAAIAIVRGIDADILVLQEIDQGSDEDPASVARLFADRLRNDPLGDLAGEPHDDPNEHPQGDLQKGGVRPSDFPYVFSAPSNTGRLTGIDLSGDGLIATEEHSGSREHGDDSYGFGTYPGQYSMAVLSRTPFDLEGTRTFQRFLWKDLPGHHIDTGLEEPFLSEQAREIFRLSSKSHWDLAVKTADDPGAPVIRLLVSHPTPPVFDGSEDRNGRRNFDELLFWAHYLDGVEGLADDRGFAGGYGVGLEASGFVVAGDLNAFPQASVEAGDSVYDGRTAISQLLEHPLVQDSGAWLTSAGAVVHSGEPAGAPWFRERATAGFGGGLRIDYLLPSVGLEILAGGVFWPDPEVDARGAGLAGVASDHRLVWVDLGVPPEMSGS